MKCRTSTSWDVNSRIQLSPLSLNCCRMKSLSLFLKRWNLFNIWSRFVTDLWFVAIFIRCGLVSGTGMGTYKTRKTNSHLSCSEERNRETNWTVWICGVCMFPTRAMWNDPRWLLPEGGKVFGFSGTATFWDKSNQNVGHTAAQPKPRSWLALVNEYADSAFSSIFQAIGDRQGGFTCQMKLTINSKVPTGSDGFQCTINMGSAECAFSTGHGWTKLISYLFLTPESRTWLSNLNLLNRSLSIFVPSPIQLLEILWNMKTHSPYGSRCGSVGWSKLSATRGILSGEHHEKSARDLRLSALCHLYSKTFIIFQYLDQKLRTKETMFHISKHNMNIMFFALLHALTCQMHPNVIQWCMQNDDHIWSYIVMFTCT